MKQNKLNRILIVVLVVIICYLAYQKITEPRRVLFNQCYYVYSVQMTLDDEALKELKPYCREWAKDELNERGD